MCRVSVTLQGTLPSKPPAALLEQELLCDVDDAGNSIKGPRQTAEQQSVGRHTMGTVADHCVYIERTADRTESFGHYTIGTV